MSAERIGSPRMLSDLLANGDFNDPVKLVCGHCGAAPIAHEYTRRDGSTMTILRPAVACCSRKPRPAPEVVL